MRGVRDATPDDHVKRVGKAGPISSATFQRSHQAWIPELPHSYRLLDSSQKYADATARRQSHTANLVRVSQYSDTFQYTVLRTFFTTSTYDINIQMMQSTICKCSSPSFQYSQYYLQHFDISDFLRRSHISRNVHAMFMRNGRTLPLQPLKMNCSIYNSELTVYSKESTIMSERATAPASAPTSDMATETAPEPYAGPPTQNSSPAKRSGSSTMSAIPHS